MDGCHCTVSRSPFCYLPAGIDTPVHKSGRTDRRNGLRPVHRERHYRRRMYAGKQEIHRDRDQPRLCANSHASHRGGRTHREADDMKLYTVTEKQLDELKKLLERLEETPREKAKGRRRKRVDSVRRRRADREPARYPVRCACRTAARDEVLGGGRRKAGSGGNGCAHRNERRSVDYVLWRIQWNARGDQHRGGDN